MMILSIIQKILNISYSVLLPGNERNILNGILVWNVGLIFHLLHCIFILRGSMPNYKKSLRHEIKFSNLKEVRDSYGRNADALQGLRTWRILTIWPSHAYIFWLPHSSISHQITRAFLSDEETDLGESFSHFYFILNLDRPGWFRFFPI